MAAEERVAQAEPIPAWGWMPPTLVEVSGLPEALLPEVLLPEVAPEVAPAVAPEAEVMPEVAPEQHDWGPDEGPGLSHPQDGSGPGGSV